MSLMLSEQTKVYGGTALCSPLGPAAHIYCFLPLLLTAKKPRRGWPWAEGAAATRAIMEI